MKVSSECGVSVTDIKESQIFQGNRQIQIPQQAMEMRDVNERI